MTKKYLNKQTIQINSSLRLYIYEYADKVTFYLHPKNADLKILVATFKFDKWPKATN